MTIIWTKTKLGVWYPTIDGDDAFMLLWKRHGLTFCDAPAFEDYGDARQWAADHGHKSVEGGAA